MTDIAEIVRQLTDGVYDKTGRPVAGKLQTAWLTVCEGGWEAVAVFRFVESWNRATGPDPIACLIEVLTTPPRLQSPRVPDVIEDVVSTAAAVDDDELLV